MDAIVSATERYFASKELLYTFINGKRIDVIHLHIVDWLDRIWARKQQKCNIDYGFEKAIAPNMGTLALKLGHRTEWDHTNNFFVNVTMEEIMEVFRG